ncbi:MAG TPA: GFA family protein [Rhizomicrobium sp.]
MKTASKKHRGSCLCGEIRFSFTGALDDAYFCHCTQCRKNYGMHGAFVGVARDKFSINKSKFLKSYGSSPSTVRQFCGKCGSPISWDRKGYENIYVCLGLLDGKIDVPKVTNIHTKDKGAYYDLS